MQMHKSDASLDRYPGVPIEYAPHVWPSLASWSQGLVLEGRAKLRQQQFFVSINCHIWGQLHYWEYFGVCWAPPPVEDTSSHCLRHSIFFTAPPLNWIAPRPLPLAHKRKTRQLCNAVTLDFFVQLQRTYSVWSVFHSHLRNVFSRQGMDIELLGILLAGLKSRRLGNLFLFVTRRPCRRNLSRDRVVDGNVIMEHDFRLHLVFLFL